MNLSKTRDFLGKFSYLNIFHYSAMACYYPFIVAFLTKRDYSSTQIGAILTIDSIVAIISQPIWGIICDRIRSVRKVYIALAIVISITIPILPTINRYLIHLIYIPFCIILFYCPFNPLIDAWMVQGLKNLPGKTYGSIRLWGSAGYMVTTALMGWISDRFKIETVFVCFSVFMLINIIVALSIREEGVPQVKDQPETAKGEKPFMAMLKNYRYVTFIICMFVLNLPLTLKNGFFVPRLYLAGGTDFIFGLCSAASALIEIPIFILASRYLSNVKPQRLILFSMTMYLINFTLITLPIPPYMFILVNGLSGFGYSIFLIASISYIDSMSPPEFKTSALTLATGIYGGASGIVGNLIAGVIIDSLGLIRSFWYGVVFVAFSIVFFMVFLLTANLKEQKALQTEK